MKVANHEIVFREFPDEITLAINFSNCPHNCPNCHSAYLQQDIGENLTVDMINEWYNKDPYITCIGLMGGDADHVFINNIAGLIKQNHPKLKLGWYSGNKELDECIELKNFDYIKLGPYIEKLGPINEETSNQKMYEVLRTMI